MRNDEVSPRPLFGRTDGGGGGGGGPVRTVYILIKDTARREEK